MSELSLEDLHKAVAALTEKVATLETKIAALESQREIPEEHLVAIGAAVAAYFGHKAKVRAVRYGTQSRWAAAARSRVHDRSVPHSR